MTDSIGNCFCLIYKILYLMVLVTAINKLTTICYLLSYTFSDKINVCLYQTLPLA